MAVIAFTTAFAQPDAPTGLVITDSGDSLVTLAWDVSLLSASIFDHYRIERQVGEAPWELAGEVSDVNDPTFTDYAAPTGALVRYRVRVSIGYTGLDSEPLEGEADTVSQWAVVVPDDETLTEGGLYIDAGATMTEPWDVSFPRPLGRAYPLASEEPRPLGRMGRVWSCSITIPFSHAEIADKVFEWQRRTVIFKAPDGWVGWVRITGWSKTYQPAGLRRGSFTATEVLRAAP